MDSRPQKKFNILLLGDSCIDTYVYGYVDRISPEAPVPVFVPTREEAKPGMAGNVSENLKALGCKVNFLTGEVSQKARLIDERSRQHIIRVDADKYSDPITFETAIPAGYDAIVISDYNKGTISYNLIEDLRKEFKGPIFVDTKKTDLARLTGTIIKINSYEYDQLTSEPDYKTDLIVTQGEKGVVWNNKTFLARKVEVSDVCGAGDTFLAALVYQYLVTNSMEQAIKFAIKASAITVQHTGCYAPKLKEIK